MNRVEAIRSIYEENKNAHFILSNGLTSREASYAIPRPKSFYLLHGMGEAFSVGLGLAIAKPHINVVVIDGDGNSLMGLASLSMKNVGNIKYYILANGVYQTTGSQPIPALKILPDWAIVIDINEDVITSPNPPAPETIWNNYNKHELIEE
jgi:thiamine pyrophosphate-dependent acetolactate synthase large subunit-like protein